MPQQKALRAWVAAEGAAAVLAAVGEARLRRNAVALPNSRAHGADHAEHDEGGRGHAHLGGPGGQRWRVPAQCSGGARDFENPRLNFTRIRDQPERPKADAREWILRLHAIAAAEQRLKRAARLDANPDPHAEELAPVR